MLLTDYEYLNTPWYELFYAHGHFCKCTAIFISYNSNFNIIKYHRDLDGRFQFVDIDIDEIIYRLININAPNDDRDWCFQFNSSILNDNVFNLESGLLNLVMD